MCTLGEVGVWTAGAAKLKYGEWNTKRKAVYPSVTTIMCRVLIGIDGTLDERLAAI